MPPTEKDFDAWNEEKKRVEAFDYRKPYKEGEIWWCALGTNIGSEQDGTGNEYDRPVLILKKINKQVCYVLPLTTSKKEYQYHVYLGVVDGKEASGILSQIRPIDTKRLTRRIGIIDPCMFLYIRESARNLF